MKFFNVYNKKGEKIGEISEYESGGGCALFALVIAMLVLGWGAWSAIFGNVESKGGIIFVCLMIVSSLICIGYGITKGKYLPFIDLTIYSLIIDTLVIGVGYWIIMKVTENASVGDMVLTLFIGFLSSVFLAIVSSVIVIIIKKFFKESK